MDPRGWGNRGRGRGNGGRGVGGRYFGGGGGGIGRDSLQDGHGHPAVISGRVWGGGQQGDRRRRGHFGSRGAGDAWQQGGAVAGRGAGPPPLAPGSAGNGWIAARGRVPGSSGNQGRGGGTSGRGRRGELGFRGDPAASSVTGTPASYLGRILDNMICYGFEQSHAMTVAYEMRGTFTVSMIVNNVIFLLLLLLLVICFGIIYSSSSPSCMQTSWM